MIGGVCSKVVLLLHSVHYSHTGEELADDWVLGELTGSSAGGVVEIV